MEKSVRLALWLWYRGENFLGYQRQATGITVQSALETALRAVGLEGTPLGSGRTDKGVHARMQVVGVRGPPKCDVEQLSEALRAKLPPGLGLVALRVADRSFHAQWTVRAKEYRYRLSAGAPPSEWTGLTWNVLEDERLEGLVPNLKLLPELLAEAHGTRDFFAFHESSSPRKPRTLTQATVVEREENFVEVRLVGEGFARYQVRFLVGTAVRVSAGGLTREAWSAALETSEPLRGLRAPAKGLTLWEVIYPERIDPFESLRREPPEHLPRHPPFI